MSDMMTTGICMLLAPFGCNLAADAQNSPHNKVVSLSSIPPDLPMGVIPHRFELTDRPTIFGSHVFQVEAATATSPPAHLHHIWLPSRNKVKVQFGRGMGGWERTLKLSDTNDLAGNLKPFCETTRCGRPKQVFTTRAKRVECP